jgi:hypothetical protein
VTAAQPAGADPPTLAPEVSASIRAAQDELAHAVQAANLTGDPMRHALEALSAHLGAMHKLIADGNLTLAAQVERAQRPISDDDLARLERAAATGAERRAGELARAHNWRHVMIGAGILVLAIGVGFGGGYWWRGSQQLIAGLQAGDRTCQDVAGGTQCYIPIWTKLPPQGGRQ